MHQTHMNTVALLIMTWPIKGTVSVPLKRWIIEKEYQNGDPMKLGPTRPISVVKRTMIFRMAVYEVILRRVMSTNSSPNVRGVISSSAICMKRSIMLEVCDLLRIHIHKINVDENAEVRVDMHVNWCRWRVSIASWFCLSIDKNVGRTPHFRRYHHCLSLPFCCYFLLYSE